MPLYEFDCRACGEPFEELVLSANGIDDVSCPSCGSEDVRKKLSTFATRMSGGVYATPAGGASCSPGGF
jgi:putative FmdB family regulatory protein